MNIRTIVCSGFAGNPGPIGAIRLKPTDMGTASEAFGSTFILRMGLHYDRYVLGGPPPNYQAVPALYTAAAIAGQSVGKARASSVTGNIGESIAGLVARRKLGSRPLDDVLPVVASSRAKSPDFVMKLRPMFPASFGQAVGANLTVAFRRWPVESKAVETDGKAGAAVRKALLQLGTYWYERYPFEPSVCGYGIVVCFTYRGDPRKITVHVFTPSNQAALQAAIAQYRQATDRDGYLTQLSAPNSILRGYLRDT